MAGKSDPEGPQSVSDALKTVGEELGSKTSLREHLIVAAVLGGIFGTFIIGMYIALTMGLFTPDGAPPVP